MATLARSLSVALAAIVVGMFVHDALVLVAYPFDWDPSEGLLVEVTMRLRRHGLAAIYPAGEVVPAPFTYGPLVPALLAILARDAWLLPAARLLGTAFALATAAAVYALVRGRASRAVALAFAALALVPASRSFWLVLARVDSAMIACWLWAAVCLLPARLVRGSGRLAGWRAIVGALLLVLAVLAKPTAVLIGAPLVLGWLLVDLRSALRVGFATLLIGGAGLAGLELATGGGFWRTLALQSLVETVPGQTGRLILGALVTHAGVTAFLPLALAMASGRRDGSTRDGAWLLWLAGPLVVPTLAKAGAIFNYLLPWAIGQVALVGRLVAHGMPGKPGAGRGLPAELAGAVPAAGLAFALALGGFPLPTAQDQRTAESFYGFVAARGAPMLAVQPDLAYVYARQPVLLELLFPYLYQHGLPGTRQLFARLDRREFKTVVENLDRWSLRARGYTAVGGCELGYHHGHLRAVLLVPAVEAASVRFAPLPGSRCLAAGR
jgi:hypothetical protein